MKSMQSLILLAAALVGAFGASGVQAQNTPGYNQTVPGKIK
jgi:hypothetical protein